MLNNLIPVEWSNQRVLTTAQLAEVYECNPKNIKVNFGNAKEQFVEGVHYFKLTGEALRQFKGQVKGIDLPISTFASHLYLWTYQGCVRHCKMLNTPKAWEMFDELENHYFENNVVTLPAPAAVEEVAPVKMASVYSFLLSNTLVKIGFSGNVKKRKEHFKGVKRTYSSPPVAVNHARDIERIVKEKFFAHRVEGEFFNITFEEAVTEIKRHFPNDADAADFERLRLLVDLCAVAPEPLKEQLVRQTANLLIGKNIF